MPDEARVVRTLRSIPEYRALFAQAFPEEKRPVRLDTAARALAAFERTLTTRARFDRYLAGEKDALGAQELRGLHTFVTSGCTTCHNGPALGGTSFQKLGLVGDYAKDFPETARLLRDKYDGSYERFWEEFWSRPLVTKPGDYVLVNSWGMAAAYSAEDDGRVRLPFDDTGKLIPDVWERWLRWDPVRMVSTHAEALRGMRAIYIDAGKSDEYYLDLGAEAFRRELELIGVRDVFFELFEGEHGGIVWRYPIALRYLAERLA